MFTDSKQICPFGKVEKSKIEKEKNQKKTGRKKDIK